MNIGDYYLKEFSFSQEEVHLFAELTGDKNPLHFRPRICKANSV